MELILYNDSQDEAKMKDIKQYSDDALKTLVAKDDIVKVTDFTEEQCNLIKDLTSKITAVEEKVNSSEATVRKLNAKFSNLEEKRVYLCQENNFMRLLSFITHYHNMKHFLFYVRNRLLN